MRIPKGLWALAMVVALAVPSVLAMQPTEAAGPAVLARTGWQVFQTPTYVSGIGFSTGQHGDTRYYDYAPYHNDSPPAPADAAPGWQNCGSTPVCPDANTINMHLTSRLPGCWSVADFTYFQSFVSIPENATITEFKVDMGDADDGARVSIINSAYPGGFVFEGSYIFLGGAQSTTDLAPYVKKGEVNRVVITQVDDCASGNNLGSAAITLNGNVVPVAPSTDLALTKTAPASVTVGQEFDYQLTLQNLGPTPAAGVAIADPLPPTVQFVSVAGPGCNHPGSPSGGVVSCPNVGIGGNSAIPITIRVRALAPGVAVNNASITALGSVLDPNPANNQAGASTIVNEVPAPPAPPFIINGTLPSATANICLPTYMDQDLQTQYWWVSALGTGPLNITLFGVGVNNAESGTVSMKVVSPANVTVGTVSVAQPPSGEVPATPVVVGAPAAGAIYRVEVKVASPPSGPVARHYRLSVNGASLTGTNSTLQPQAEHDDVRWKVNVAAGEPLTVVVLPAAEAPLTAGTLALIPPGGGAPVITVVLTGAGGVASIASPAAGQWTASIGGLDGHYLLQKVGGADTGLYLGWDSAGYGGLSTVTVLNSLGGPNTNPVTVELINPAGAVLAVPGVTGSTSWPKLPVGAYAVRLAGSSDSVPLVVTCDAPANATLQIPNSPPVAVDDSATTNAGFPVTVAVLTNDSDSDGGTLAVTGTSTPANGTVVVNPDGTVTYSPGLGFSGTDTFTYTVSDGQGGEATATVTITVQAASGSRMTGGGSIQVGKGRDATRSTWGFEIRCDGSRANLEYQDHTGGNFHMEAVTSVFCIDNPAIGSGVPRAGFDTLLLTGAGRWNGVSGHLVQATIVDAGEPGTVDSIVITVTTAGGSVVSTLTGTLTGGNHQAH